MLWWLTGIVSLGLYSSYLSKLVLLSVSLPMGMFYLYKSFAYLEDMEYCLNDMNGMLIFMTLSLSLLIYLASPSLCSGGLYDTVFFSLVYVLVLCFGSSNLLWFYICFEISLLPILILIIGWGYQPERIQAGLYMIFYTVFGSLPLFFLILYLGSLVNTFNLFLIWNLTLSKLPWLFYVGFLAFLIKLPIWSLHVWLPKAHVEAPLGGSMILAGVLLKLGGYGLYVYNSIGSSSLLNPILIYSLYLAVWGGVCASVVCLNQSDIKAMIAYSSVVHMCLVVLGILSNTTWGCFVALISMVAHGWASSALFLCAFITYEKVGSRSFNYTKGILMVFPTLSLFWFLITMVNMAVPPTINLVGELAAVPVALGISGGLLFMLLIILFTSVTYNMFLYTKINHGLLSTYILGANGPTSRFLLILMGHLMPLCFLFHMNIMSLYTAYCM